MKQNVALICQDLATAGGVGTMVKFLYQVLEQTDRYSPSIVTIPISSRDDSSFKFLPSRSHLWRKVQCVQKSYQGLHYTHVGANFPEIETQRYQPRNLLTNLLKQFDVLQFISGTPAIANVGLGIGKPIFIWTASTVRSDRKSRISQLSLNLRKLLYQTMTGLMEKLEIKALRHADHVFALSKHTYDLITPHVPNNRSSIASCGIDTDVFLPKMSTIREGSTAYMLFVGRLSDPRKRIDLLLQSYKSARISEPTIPQLWLVGADEDGQIGKLVVSLGLQDTVSLLGPKSGQDLIDIYQRARFLVLSSDEEGLGIVLLEAMACGIPAITTKSGGPETIVKDGKTGYIVERRDTKALEYAMIKLSKDGKQRQSLGNSARKIAESQYSLQVTGKAFIDVYDRLLQTESLS